MLVKFPHSSDAHDHLPPYHTAATPPVAQPPPTPSANSPHTANAPPAPAPPGRASMKAAICGPPCVSRAGAWTDRTMSYVHTTVVSSILVVPPALAVRDTRTACGTGTIVSILVLLRY